MGGGSPTGHQVQIVHGVSDGSENQPDRNRKLHDPHRVCEQRAARQGARPGAARRRAEKQHASTFTPSFTRKMMLSTITGGVKPTSIVVGISRSGTILRNLNQAAVGANEPMPSVSKKATTAPRPIASTFGLARFWSADRMSTKVKSRLVRTRGMRRAISIAYPSAITERSAMAHRRS